MHAEMDMARRLKAHRVLSLALCILTLASWGALICSAGSSTRIIGQLREELAQLEASQDRLLAERKQQQEVLGDLTQLQAKLASVRAKLQVLDHKREAQEAAVPEGPTELTKWLEGRRA